MFRKLSILFVVLAALVACHEAELVRVTGEKVDSGLGRLPNYSQWNSDPKLSRYVLTSVPGEKIDNGLGAMPHYSQWKDDPELSRLAAAEGGSAPIRIALVSR
jgi:hypothetical protein